jgi:hypothetical protein
MFTRAIEASGGEDEMKHRSCKPVSAQAAEMLLCVLFSNTPASGDDSATGDAVAEDGASEEKQAETGTEDILDRMFSPLDNAVSDLNRDMNKGDSSADTDAPIPGDPE